jgi:hypothetical protein
MAAQPVAFFFLRLLKNAHFLALRGRRQKGFFKKAVSG